LFELPVIRHQLIELHETRRDIVQVAELSFYILTHLNVHDKVQTRAVCINRYNLFKALERGIPLDLIANIHSFIEHGLILREHERPSSFIVSTTWKATGRRIKIACKIARGGYEIWISSIHLTRQKQTKSLVHRGIIIQSHK